jgi:competence CoiA-like predicted nuclease
VKTGNCDHFESHKALVEHYLKEHPEVAAPAKPRPLFFRCPVCKKKFPAEQGMKDHHRFVHTKVAAVGDQEHPEKSLG